MATSTPTSQCKIIAIGASAGGLSAIRNFFDALPADTGICFVVIMHLSPQHKSNLAELIASKTEMAVTQVNQTVSFEPNHVYVIPPNKRLETNGSELSIFDFEEPRGKRAPIDYFFRSLAKCPGAGAIIFSGAGTDGSVGLKDINEAGGLILVQDPKEAEYSSMPTAAIETGMADVVLPVRDIAKRLLDINRQSPNLKTGKSPAIENNSSLKDLLTILRAKTGHDFSNYKNSTIQRRVKRRMQVTNQDELDGYQKYLEKAPEEPEALLNDLLIGVTNFFRNNESYDKLKTKIFPEIFKDKKEETIRIWSVGCSTGEEAYSLAILLDEYSETLKNRPKIQIFATDIDKESLTTARRGLFPHAIEADVSEERLSRYFEKEEEHYRIHRRLRERILFSEHNALRDPPFSKIDLITCRNLLIYLNRDPQDQIFKLFHYALRPEGFLFLGSSESADNVPELFRLIDKQHRLFKAKKRSTGMPRIIPYATSGYPKESKKNSKEEVVPEAELHRLSLEKFSPPSLLVDENHHIVHISERAGRYMNHPGGPITSEVTRLVSDELQSELRLALLMAFEGKATVARPVKMKIDDQPVLIYLTVRPAPQQNEEEKLALVIFNESEDVPDNQDKHVENPPYDQLKEELYYASQRLKTVSREYEASREELQAQNEELLSINEEYKSTVEELETSKEEIESINEELETVNGELNIKIDEVSKAHNDLQNLITATEISTVFLDKELNIQFYTPLIENLFNIRETDIGRPFLNLTPKFNYESLKEDSQLVIDKVTSIEREIHDETTERWYLVSLHPYKNMDEEVDGVVITFIDISDLKRTEHALREEKKYAELLFDTVHEGVLVMDRKLHIQSATTSFYELFNTSPAETTGKRLYQLGNNQWDIPDLRKLLDEIVPKNKELKNFEVEHYFEDIGHRVMLLNVSPVESKDLVLMAIQDVTDYKKAVNDVKELNETLEDRVNERTRKIRDLASKLSISEQEERNRISSILHDDLQQILFAASMNMDLIKNRVNKGDINDLSEQITETQEHIKSALKKTRDLTSDLNPTALKSEDLTEIMEWFIKWFEKDHSLKVNLKPNNDVQIPKKGVRIILLQSIRELLFNIMKHGGTDHAQIVHGIEDEQVYIHIIDEGKGFNVQKITNREKHEQGFGLASVRERLNLHGGDLELDSSPGKGTRASIRLPLSELHD